MTKGSTHGAATRFVRLEFARAGPPSDESRTRAGGASYACFSQSDPRAGRQFLLARRVDGAVMETACAGPAERRLDVLRGDLQTVSAALAVR
ncbi:MAG: hypothetical protein GC154_21590 [bacterium]|nr:hypothetical protein [bacterium]